MIRVKLFLLTLIIFPAIAFSQTKGLRIGALAGIGEARIKNSSFTNVSGKLAFSGGLGMNYQFFKNFGLYGNILFTSKGGKATASERVQGFFGSVYYPYRQNINLYSIEIPVMPKVSIGLGNFHFKAFAGPSLNFNIIGYEDREYEDPDRNEDYGYIGKDLEDLNVLEYAFVFGGGVDVETGSEDIFYLEVRSSTGLNNFSVNNGADTFSRYLMVGVGYLYKY